MRLRKPVSALEETAFEEEKHVLTIAASVVGRAKGRGLVHVDGLRWRQKWSVEGLRGLVHLGLELRLWLVLGLRLGLEIRVVHGCVLKYWLSSVVLMVELVEEVTLGNDKSA